MLNMKHYNDTQPNLIKHYISHSIPPPPLHLHLCTQSHNASLPPHPSKTTTTTPNKQTKKQHTIKPHLNHLNAITKFVGVHVFLVPIAIEDDYTGPQLEDGKVTEKFVKDLMETFKDQKGLHKKYAYKVSTV